MTPTPEPLHLPTLERCRVAVVEMRNDVSSAIKVIDALRTEARS